MRKLLLFFGLIILLCTSVFSQKVRNKDFIGVFRDCLLHCSTYYINADFTFEYTAKGDMFNEERKGTWKYIGNDKIRIFAPGEKQKSEKIFIQQNDGKLVEAKIPEVNKRAIKETLVVENGELCILDKKAKTEFCFKKIEIKSD